MMLPEPARAQARLEMAGAEQAALGEAHPQEPGHHYLRGQVLELAEAGVLA